ncbi:MAG TPA: YARHG domain-containing protein [Mucilaginibacter sp.]
MKFIIRIGCVAAIFYLQSCGGSAIKHKNDDQEQTAGKSGKSKIPVPAATTNLIIKDDKDIVGYWVGMFGPDVTGPDTTDYDEVDNEGYNKINISIDEINGTKIKGHTVIAGKVRFFKCGMEKNGSKYEFAFTGGADEKDDGAFAFSITEGDTLMKATWNGGSKSSGFDYKLTKSLFRYDPNWKLSEVNYIDYKKSKTVKEKTHDGETYTQSAYATTSDDLYKHNPSSEVLTKEDVANLKKADLLILRNSIFARHGYTFKKPLLNFFFSQQPWYVPLSTDVTAELTDTEKKNLKLMIPYEKNAQEYYNAFGR